MLTHSKGPTGATVHPEQTLAAAGVIPAMAPSCLLQEYVPLQRTNFCRSSAGNHTHSLPTV